MPPRKPTFRFHNKLTGDLMLACTERARQVAEIVKRQKSSGIFGKQLSKEEVEREAKKRLLQTSKGDPEDKEWVLSLSCLQFGKYRGKPFIWLVENDVGWAVMLMADHEAVREKPCSTSPDAQWDNKEALYRYVNMFPEMRKAIKARRDKRPQPKLSTTEGDILVGFGPYSNLSRQALFLSTEKEHESYVKGMLRHPVTYPGGKLDMLKKYLIKMQAEQTAEDEAMIRVAEKVEKSYIMERASMDSQGAVQSQCQKWEAGDDLEPADVVVSTRAHQNSQ
ncbi:uncharacterized protein [Apostichopus japonicus]|uniref:uncharacterized protein n=1 Tax=Stichopus japonicus TaxID=307972 RepID=UPI003AB6B77A